MPNEDLRLSESVTFQLCGLDPERQSLDFRQREVLSALSEDSKAVYSFQGLRRKLGFHQEILSRTLDRLEDQNLVEKTSDGYRINSDKDADQFGYVAEGPAIESHVVTAHLPREADVTLILNTLKGRWFGEFRWLGYSEIPSGLVLSWITDDGRVQLRAKISGDTLVISALYRSGTDAERAAMSAFELFDFLTRQNSLPATHGILN